MITINLLPESYHKAAAAPIPQLHRSPLVLIVAAIVLALTMLLALARQVRQMQLSPLTEQLRQLQPKRVEVERLRLALAQLRHEQTTFEGLRPGESAWAMRLNELSDATPEGIWLTTVSLDPVHGLVIEGAALGDEGQEMAKIGQFVQSLKDQPAVASTVREIQIESIKSVKDGDIEITLFTVTCQLGSPSPS